MTFSMTVLKLRFFAVFALPSPFWGEISFETFHFQRRESGTEKSQPENMTGRKTRSDLLFIAFNSRKETGIRETFQVEIVNLTKSL